MDDDIYISFGADTGPLEAEFAKAKAEVRGLTAELNKTANAERAAGAAADSDLGQHMTTLGGQLSAAKGRMSELNETLKAHNKAAHSAGEEVQGLLAHVRQIAEGIQGYREAFSSAARFYVEAFAVHEIAEWVDTTAEAAEHIERLSHQLGASTDQVQQMGAMARLTGTDVDGMAAALERLQLGLARTNSSTSMARAGLQALEIDADRFRKLSIPQQWDELAEAASQFADGVNKTAAFEALGRQFEELLPLFDKGKEGLRELNDIIERAGVVMSDATVRGFDEMKLHIAELSLAWQGFSQRLLNVLRPAIDAAIQELSRLLEAAKPAVLQDDLNTFANALDAMAGGVSQWAKQARTDWAALVSYIEDTVKPLQDVADFLNKIVDAEDKIRTASGGGLLGILDRLTGHHAGGIDTATGMINPDAAVDNEHGYDPTSGAITGARQQINAFTAAIRAAAAALRSRPPSARSDAAMGGELYNGPGPAKPQAHQLQEGGRAGRAGKGKADHSDEQEAREAYQTEVDAARRAAQGQLDALDNLVKQHKISWDTWAADSIADLEKEKAAIQAAAAEAKNSDALTAAEKIRIANEAADAIAAINKREADDAAKAAEETAKAWDNFFKPFNQAIERQVQEVASGHETMRQAFAKLINSMVADAAKFFTQWALKQAEMVAAHVAGNSVISASDQAANLFGLGQLLADAGKAISVDAGVTAAGVAANQAPLTGPLALGEGAAAASTVLGFAAYDIGAWKLPQDQVALVHQNELVMPAAEAGAFRDMLSGAARGQGQGGGDVHIHPTVHVNMGGALDGASVSLWMRHNGPGMVKAIDEAVRHGAALGAKRLR